METELLKVILYILGIGFVAVVIAAGVSLAIAEKALNELDKENDDLIDENIRLKHRVLSLTKEKKVVENDKPKGSVVKVKKTKLNSKRK